MKKLLLIWFMILVMLLTGCTNTNDIGDTDNSSETTVQSKNSSDDTDVNDDDTSESDLTAMFSDRDFDAGYDESKSALITLSGDSAVCTSSSVKISENTITITDEGTYIFSGTLDDGMIIVNTDKKDKVQLVLDGATVHSKTSAPIYILQSDKVFITTAAESVNTLSNGGSFTAIDENNIDSVIFSKEDLTLNGYGTLIVTSPAGHGIVSKDSLTVTGGTYDINSSSHAMCGKDDVCIANADITIVSGKDGIHAENAEDATLGLVYIQSGSFAIAAEGDGISASADMQIENGSFDITSGGGSENAEARSSDSWGDFMGGGRHQGGRPGGGFENENPSKASETEDDSASLKGIKAARNLQINSGTFKINSADDSIHSDSFVSVNGGSFEIASGDDAFHAEETLTVADGTVNITESYEGLEGLHVVVSGGDITLVADDDGINGAGGTDSSGAGGRDAMFGGPGMPSSSNGSITISGGKLNITASGDGIDANGSLEITDGYTVVCGPTQGDTATLDYDTSAIISGGTFIGTGASGMAQTFSDSEQGVISLNVGNQSANTGIKLTDSSGNTLITYSPKLSFSVVILSSPEIISGETYKVDIGSVSGNFAAT